MVKIIPANYVPIFERFGRKFMKYIKSNMKSLVRKDMNDFIRTIGQLIHFPLFSRKNDFVACFNEWKFPQLLPDVFGLSLLKKRLSV
jgi:hypothetical protein